MPKENKLVINYFILIRTLIEPKNEVLIVMLIVDCGGGGRRGGFLYKQLQNKPISAMNEHHKQKLHNSNGWNIIAFLETFTQLGISLLEQQNFELNVAGGSPRLRCNNGKAGCSRGGEKPSANLYYPSCKAPDP